MSFQRACGRVFFVGLLVSAAQGCGPSASGGGGGGGGGAADAGGGGGGADAAGGGGGADATPAVTQMYVHSADTLYSMDDQSFDLTLIGSFGLPMSEGITDLAVTPDGGLYGISETKLYRIDATTGHATFVASVAGQQNVGMTFLPDGRLLATDKDGGVRRIDPGDGDVEEVGSLGGGYTTAGDLVAVADGTMYDVSDTGPNGDEYDDNVLLIVDATTGEYTQAVGQIGYGKVFGCAYADGHVFAFTGDGDVIEIDRTTGHGSLKRSYPDVAFWGAGVSPLVTVD